MAKLAIGDLVEYRSCIAALKERIGTIGIVSDQSGFSDAAVTIIFPAWEMDEVGEEIYPSPLVWKKIGRADL